MPHHELLQRMVEPPLVLVDKWKVNGLHYSYTLEAWLKKMDGSAAEVRRLFCATYGEENADMWVNRWRTFFMACSELFAYDAGQTWYVSHYGFEKKH